MEDRWLVSRCKCGDTDALRRIYTKYKNELLVLAVALLNDKAGAEDVLHDVFVTFVRGLDGFELTGSLKGYLATCVANRAKNYNRSARAGRVDMNQAQPAISNKPEPVETIILNEQLQKLSSALAQLPFEQRQVVTLHMQTRLSLRAISKSLGVGANTVKSRYRYGIEKLRSILNSEVTK